MPNPISNSLQPQTSGNSGFFGGLVGLGQNIGNAANGFIKNYTPIGLAEQGIGNVANQVKSALALPGQQAQSSLAGQNAQSLYNTAANAGANNGATFQSSLGSPNAFNASQNPGQTNGPSSLLSTANAQTVPTVPTSTSLSAPAAGGAAALGAAGAGTAPLTPQTATSVTPAPPVAPVPPAGTGTTDFGANVQTESGYGQASSPQYQAAQAEALQAQQKLAALQTSANTALGNLAGSRTNNQWVAGQGNQIQNSLALQEAPLTQEIQAAQQTAQTATGQQQAQQSAAAAAAGLNAPTAANPYGTYNPAQVSQGTGGYTGYGGGAGGTGIGSAGQVTGSLQASQNYYSTMLPNYTSAANDVQSFNSWLNTPQAQGGGQGVNFSQFNAGNQLQNWVEGQNVSDPRFPQLSTFLNDFGNKISSVVGASGGDITNYKQQLVNAMISPDATPASIQAQIGTIMNVAQQTMKGVYDSFSGNANGQPWQTSSAGNSQASSGYPPYFGS